MPVPLYTVETCPNPAYQLKWAYTLFWHQPPKSADWLDGLKKANEPDGIRILQHEFTSSSISQFLVSTKPEVVPQTMIQRIKGRLQTQLRPLFPNAFQRNYALRSIGWVDRITVNNYVAGQLQHHPLADPRAISQLEKYQFADDRVKLETPSRTSHGIYWYNLHLVLVNAERYRSIDDGRLSRLLLMIKSVAQKKQQSLSRVGILPDHCHLTLRAPLDVSPAEVALSYLNNLAYALGMRPEFRFSYYVGTFGEYTTKAIR